MKGAYLVSEDQMFFDEMVQVLTGMGAEYRSGDSPTVQFKDEAGRYLTVYGGDIDKYYLESWAGPFAPADSSMTMPNLDIVSACSVECRWNDLFVNIVTSIAARISKPMWVLDEVDVVWPADAIDVNRISL